MEVIVSNRRTLLLRRCPNARASERPRVAVRSIRFLLLWAKNPEGQYWPGRANVKSLIWVRTVGIMGFRALSSGGERFLDTEEVGGSNPPAPTTKGPGHRAFSHFRRLSKSACSAKSCRKVAVRPIRELPFITRM